MPFIVEFVAFLRTRKRYWLIPILLALAVIGGLLVVVHGSPLGPFIYTVF